MATLKLFLVVIFIYACNFEGYANELFNDAVPLDVDKAFLIEHMMVGSNELVVRLHISENYYLYKEKIIFSSIDFYIDDVNFPPASVKFDEFFGLSEVYYKLIETTLRIYPKKNKNSNGILEVKYQGCWEGGICYPMTRKYLHIREL